MTNTARDTVFGLIGALACAALVPAGASAQSGGTVEHIKVPGPSLEGNLMGVATDRDVYVYLPPSYASEPGRRYPVVYNLHGWLPTAEQWIGMIELETSANRAMTEGGVAEMIVVAPDSNLVHEGGMYSNSVTTGNWEGYITKDLVEHIDANYRTLAARESRGLSGHSMGGYGTLRIGMKHPEHYAAIYAMSSCCVSPLGPSEAVAAASELETIEAAAEAGIGVRVALSEGAAWSPNPAKPPFYMDLPIENGEEQPLVIAKWAANAPLAMVDQYVVNLGTFDAIAMDIGEQDGLIGQNREFHEVLERYAIEHTFETYEGNHTNRVAERFEQAVLPFFAEHLEFEQRGSH